MPRVIQFPPHDPGQPDGARLGQAWAAFAAEDAMASAPAGLEARVLRAAQAALAEKRRAEAERKRHHWLAGLSALAASVLAASAWWLAGSRAVAVNEPNPAAPPDVQAAAPSIDASADIPTSHGSRPVPMTNVEAGRILSDAPRMLAARPLFDAVDGGMIRAATVPRAKSFSAPLVVLSPVPLRAASTPAPSASPEGAAPPTTLDVAAPDDKKTGPEVWTSRGFQGVFDPTSSQHAPAPPPQKKKDEPTPPPPQF